MAQDEPASPAILIIDDEVDIVYILKRMLSHTLPTATIVGVATAAQAIAVLTTQPIDLVPADVRMPVMSGVQLVQQIKAEWPATRVIIVSGVTPQRLAELAQSVQADGYLVKPFSRVELAQVVHQVLGA
jgi:two-component system, response regulator, stage 0 sporulation protein F